ncbi:type 1 glutamine amidotransferase [Paenibacillus sp. HN-1]|uniref:type 1 glutamine amidotransferase n=1 Tax=Paenibacillus TaxID=44249 RepID=UPI001CAA3D23|nr:MULTISPECIES: type 1 glutamine amidotransferase [Paenibacillus]MBY9079747.1 type 1 glutamine amidotransferase [Paenibacillus sp. CGMCC 1.18879]MBY9084391.1 type 1 glutamine amidotransferase [Paenibacillus sinensis]
MRLHYLQHIELEHPGSILEWARSREFEITRTRFFAGDSLPGPEDFDWLVIMGGPMNIYEEEEYPWLISEKKLIRSAIESGKTVLGLCLGAQLISDVIGGKVTKGPQPEIGWHTVRWNERAQLHPVFSFFPQESTVFQWHYDTFSILPQEAVVLADSPVCSHQAFLYGERVIGLQFHLENTQELVEGYIRESGHEMKAAAYVQTPEQVLLGSPEHLKRNNAWMAELLARLEASDPKAQGRKVII